MTGHVGHRRTEVLLADVKGDLLIGPAVVPLDQVQPQCAGTFEDLAHLLRRVVGEGASGDQIEARGGQALGDGVEDGHAADADREPGLAVQEGHLIVAEEEPRGRRGHDVQRRDLGHDHATVRTRRFGKHPVGAQRQSRDIGLPVALPALGPGLCQHLAGGIQQGQAQAYAGLHGVHGKAHAQHAGLHAGADQAAGVGGLEPQVHLRGQLLLQQGRRVKPNRARRDGLQHDPCLLGSRRRQDAQGLALPTLGGLVPELLHGDDLAALQPLDGQPDLAAEGVRAGRSRELVAQRRGDRDAVLRPGRRGAAGPGGLPDTEAVPARLLHRPIPGEGLAGSGSRRPAVGETVAFSVRVEPPIAQRLAPFAGGWELLQSQSIERVRPFLVTAQQHMDSSGARGRSDRPQGQSDPAVDAAGADRVAGQKGLLTKPLELDRMRAGRDIRRLDRTGQQIRRLRRQRHGPRGRAEVALARLGHHHFQAGRVVAPAVRPPAAAGLAGGRRKRPPGRRRRRALGEVAVSQQAAILRPDPGGHPGAAGQTDGSERSVDPHHGMHVDPLHTGNGALHHGFVGARRQARRVRTCAAAPALKKAMPVLSARVG